MNTKYIEEIEFKKPAKKQQICKLERNLNVTFPNEFRAFLQEHNGGEGPIGECNYIVFWSIEEIAKANQEFSCIVNASDIVVFASDGGSEVYAFEKDKNFRIIMTPTIYLGEERVICCDDFNDFFKYLFYYE